MSRHSSIGSFSRALTDHDLRRDKALASPAYARPGHPQYTTGSQAGGQLTAQRPTALNEESLIDSFVADAHRLVAREVDRQASGNLLRTPGFGPSSILSLAMSAAVPRNGRTRNMGPARGYDAAGKSFLHISALGCIERKLGRLGPAGRSIRMPLGSCCPILQPAAAGGRVPPQFSGDRRSIPPQAAPDLRYRMALHPE